MSSRKGRIYNDNRFPEDYLTIDQEFGKEPLHDDQTINRSATTYYRDVQEREEKSEVYLSSEPGYMSKSRQLGAPSQTEGGKSLEQLVKSNKPSEPAKDLGPELARDLK